MKKNKNRKFVNSINTYINEAKEVSRMGYTKVAAGGDTGKFRRAWSMCIPDKDGYHDSTHYVDAFDAREWPEMFDITKDGYYKWWDLLKKTRETAWSGLKIEEFEYDKVKYGPGDAMDVYYKFINDEISKSAKADAATNTDFYGTYDEITFGILTPMP